MIKWRRNSTTVCTDLTKRRLIPKSCWIDLLTGVSKECKYDGFLKVPDLKKHISLKWYDIEYEVALQYRMELFQLSFRKVPGATFQFDNYVEAAVSAGGRR